VCLAIYYHQTSRSGSCTRTTFVTGVPLLRRRAVKGAYTDFAPARDDYCSDDCAHPRRARPRRGPSAGSHARGGDAHRPGGAALTVVGDPWRRRRPHVAPPTHGGVATGAASGVARRPCGSPPRGAWPRRPRRRACAAADGARRGPRRWSL